MRRGRHAFLVGWAFLASIALASAEDPPAPAPVAPAPPVAAPAADGKPFDLLEYLAQVRAIVEENTAVPRTPATDHGLYDLWESILRPRADRMVARARRLMEPERWAFDLTGGRALHLKPAAWTSTTAELGSLYVEMGGALQQYEAAQVTITQVRPDGLSPPATGPVGGEYALGALEADLLRRARLGQVIGTDEVLAYWSLLGRVQAALLLRAEQIRRFEERLQEAEGELQGLVVGIEAGLAEKRQSLVMQMLSVRMFAAAIQAREEDRLRTLAATLPPDGEPRKAAEALLAALRQHRLAAEGHVRPPVSEYGTILRRWLKAQQDLLAVLKKAGLDPHAAVDPKPALPAK